MPPPKAATKEERAAKARPRASQLETGADYLVICQVIEDDPKLLQAVSRELIAQGALTQVDGCSKITDNYKVATVKQKPLVEDDKQLHWNFITWEDVPPVHYEFWFDRGVTEQGRSGESLEAREAGQDAVLPAWISPRAGNPSRRLVMRKAYS